LWIDRDTWLPYVDILKLNLEEAGCSWFPPGSAESTTAAKPLTVDDLPPFAELCLDRGVQSLCVTLDERGCAVYYKDDDGVLRDDMADRLPVDRVVDTTGAGDSFAAGMAFGYLHSHDYVQAAWYGNAMGAQRVASRELAAYRSLAETDRQLAEAYGTCRTTRR